MTLYLEPPSGTAQGREVSTAYEVNLNNAHQHCSGKMPELHMYEAHT